MEPKDKTTILITGDIAMDYYLVKGDRSYYDSQEKDGSRTITKKGGAYLMYDFLSESMKWSESKTGGVKFGFNDDIFNELPERCKSYSLLSCNKSENDCVWKVSEMFGFGDLSGHYNYLKKHLNHSKSDILILDDAAMDFGDNINKQAWPLFIQKPEGKNDNVPSLIIYKMSGHTVKGELWENVSTNFSDKLITVISANDLRKKEVKISKGLSWEQTALDMVFELKNNRKIDHLLKSQYLIITLQSDGAILITRKSKTEYEYKLIFDPAHIEDDWEMNQPDTIIGKMSCFTAILASKLDLNKADKDYKIDEAIKAALTAVRVFHANGYVLTPHDINPPFTKIKEKLSEDNLEYSWAFIPPPTSDPSYLKSAWSILLDNYQETKKRANLFNVARRTAIYGPGEFKNIPHAHFGNLFTVDRYEIENFRNVINLINNYIKHDDGKKPLSIGLFGPPGSGKSFSAQQIAIACLGKDAPVLEFNLSQFSGPDELTGAFHQVRDVVIKKKTPLVFWDEFDSKHYEWLQYLLAPMQDGKFQEGQISHPIGKCIFVFAGGTSYTMDTFGPIKPLEIQKYQTKIKEEEWEYFYKAFYEKEVNNYDNDISNFIHKKGPDFKSRLHGYLNILGPNKRQVYNDIKREWEYEETDVCYPIRRALFLRSILKHYQDERLEMDWGLINAFIKVDNYAHGARSLEQLIIQLKRNSEGKALLRSYLPSYAMLSIHVDHNKFTEILHDDIDFLQNSDQIAPFIHAVWMTSLGTRHVPYRKDFQFLPIFIKESNYEAAKRIPTVMAEAGLVVVAGDDHERVKKRELYLELLEETLPGNKKSRKELMAEKEHELWMKFYHDHGWKKDKKRNDFKKVHDCLVDYADLSEDDKNKDREQVTRYFDFLESAGFGIAIEK